MKNWTHSSSPHFYLHFLPLLPQAPLPPTSSSHASLVSQTEFNKECYQWQYETTAVYYQCWWHPERKRCNDSLRGARKLNYVYIALVESVVYLWSCLRSLELPYLWQSPFPSLGLFPYLSSILTSCLVAPDTVQTLRNVQWSSGILLENILTYSGLSFGTTGEVWVLKIISEP